MRSHNWKHQNVSRSLVILSVLLFSSWFAAAQSRKISPSGSGGRPFSVETAPSPSASAVKAPIEQIKTQAESMSYDREKGLIEARGNVVVVKGDQELSADYVIVNTVTEEADAYGNVVMKRGTEVWRGERLHYNFKLGAGDADRMSYNAEPFQLKAGKVQRLPGNTYKMNRASMTTCEHGFDHPHFVVKAKEITLIPDESIKGKHAVFYFGPVPFFYLPYWYRDLDESTGWNFRAGYKSDWGAFLLSSYRYPMGDMLKGESHFDYRTDRGIGLGQDFGWNTPASQGEVQFYYVNDDEPLDENDPEDKDIDSSRYRIKVKNTSTITQRSQLYLQAQYLSDEDFLEDFFESEYNDSIQPDNYMVYSHRGDSFTADLLARVRINDFYEGVNRLPEASLSILRQPLANTLLYYESKTALSNLERVYREDSSSTDYSVLRIDTLHGVNYPGSYFGFLTAVPRVGVRGTYYSATRQSVQEQQLVSVNTTNAVTGGVTSLIQTNNVDVISDGPAEFRTRFELGCETSFKAYRIWGGAANPRRHVVEPYANYTFVPEPSVLPDELYQFDSVDTLDESHQVRLGVRNQYQRKINDIPFDLVDVNLYTILLLEKDAGQDTLANFYFDGRLQPGPASLMTFDGYYDTSSSELARFNTRLEYSGSDLCQLAGEYHYVVDDVSLVSADLTFLPDRPWTWNVFGRYDAEASRFQEEGGYIQRNLDCMSIRTRLSLLPGYTRSDGSEIEDEWRIYFEFWLTAFPEMRISAKHGG